jgi:hypothetical protein
MMEPYFTLTSSTFQPHFDISLIQFSLSSPIEPSRKMPRLQLFSIILALLSCTSQTSAVNDASRLGKYYTSLPFYRTGQGTNVFTVGVGTPAVEVNLTVCEHIFGEGLIVADRRVATNVQFVMLATDDCEDCTSDSDVCACILGSMGRS